MIFPNFSPQRPTPCSASWGPRDRLQEGWHDVRNSGPETSRSRSVGRQKQEATSNARSLLLKRFMPVTIQIMPRAQPVRLCRQRNLLATIHPGGVRALSSARIVPAAGTVSRGCHADRTGRGQQNNSPHGNRLARATAWPNRGWQTSSIPINKQSYSASQPCASRTRIIAWRIVFHVDGRSRTSLGNIHPSQQICLIPRWAAP
jgi:hypothetical protein